MTWEDAEDEAEEAKELDAHERGRCGGNCYFCKEERERERDEEDPDELETELLVLELKEIATIADDQIVRNLQKGESDVPDPDISF